MALNIKAAAVLETLQAAHKERNTADFTADHDAERKRFDTLAARFALAGHAVHKGQCGDFTVTRWGLARYCQDLDALEAFARQVGAAS